MFCRKISRSNSVCWILRSATLFLLLYEVGKSNDCITFISVWSPSLSDAPKRFVISTRVLKGSTITWWGRRRWAIEGFFKTAKYQFGLASFGQQTLLGVYRWLILSFISFVLTHWVYLSLKRANLPDWKEVALLTLQQLLPTTAVSLLLIEVERNRELLASQGMALELVSI